MLDWIDNQTTFVIVLVAVLVLGFVVRLWRRRMLDRAVHNVEHGVTADQAGSPTVEKTILSQSVELHFAAPVEQVVPVLAQTKLPFMFSKVGERGWADRPTVEEAESYGQLEPTATGSRARMLWCKDSGGLAPIEADWRTLRKRLVKAAEAAGIGVDEQQGPRMERVPLGDAPAHLRPEQAALAPHQWRAAGA